MGLGRDIKKGVKKVTKAVSKTVDNVGRVTENFFKNPVGTVGAFVTNPLAAQAAVASGDKGTQAVINYADTDLAKGVGLATMTAGLLTAGGAFAPEAVGAPLAAEGAITTGGAANVVSMGGAAAGTAAAGGVGLTDALLTASLGMTAYNGYMQNKAAKKAKKDAQQQAIQAKILADEETAYYRQLEEKARDETVKAEKQAAATKNNMSRGLSDLLWGNNLLGVITPEKTKKTVLG